MLNLFTQFNIDSSKVINDYFTIERNREISKRVLESKNHDRPIASLRVSLEILNLSDSEMLSPLRIKRTPHKMICSREIEILFRNIMG